MKIGLFSKEDEAAYGGGFMWSTREGKQVRVTAVAGNDELASYYRYKDKVVVGEVVRFIREYTLDGKRRKCVYDGGARYG